MFSQQDFIARLQRIMNYYDLNASALADSLGVLRSSISHLLSERNKPSLDFVLKIVDKYPEVDLYWLLYGKGTFPKEEKKQPLPLCLLKFLFLKLIFWKTVQKKHLLLLKFL